jgi:hypothetical protein
MVDAVLRNLYSIFDESSLNCPGFVSLRAKGPPVTKSNLVCASTRPDNVDAGGKRLQSALDAFRKIVEMQMGHSPCVRLASDFRADSSLEPPRRSLDGGAQGVLVSVSARSRWI